MNFIKALLLFCFPIFGITMTAPSHNISAVSNTSPASMVEKSEFSFGNTHVNFFIGPAATYQYTNQTAGLFGQEAAITVNEALIGLTGGIAIAHKRWVSTFLVSANYGEGSANITGNLDVIPVNSTFKVKHYQLLNTLFTGYKFGSSQLNITPAIFVRYSYSHYMSNENFNLAGVPVAELTQTSNQVQAGFLENSNWKVTNRLTISTGLELAYTFFSKSETKIQTIIPIPENMQISHVGFHSALSIFALYDTKIGRFLAAPWIAYEYIVGNGSVIDSRSLITGLKIAWVI